jgi:polysaccharide deacetylase family protein (PEP-CTERM system associated)
MNLLTFDIEDWYHINYPSVDFSFFDSREDHLALLDRTEKILRTCRQHKIQGTFFVLGRLLEKRPEIGEAILKQDQELALHGYEHDLLTHQGRDRFQQELERSIRAFEQVAGFPPQGFRAPSWSITPKNTWALETLADFGFSYDSSLFPVANFLYGFPGAPPRPFYPVIAGRQLPLLEIPVSIFYWRAKRIAFSGGLYFNLWPFFLIRKMADRLSGQGKNNLFYFHPWDLWKRSPDHIRLLKARWLNLHLGDTLKKFKKLLKTFPLESIGENIQVLKNQAEAEVLDHVQAS